MSRTANGHSRCRQRPVTTPRKPRRSCRPACGLVFHVRCDTGCGRDARLPDSSLQRLPQDLSDPQVGAQARRGPRRRCGASSTSPARRCYGHPPPGGDGRKLVQTLVIRIAEGFGPARARGEADGREGVRQEDHLARRSELPRRHHAVTFEELARGRSHPRPGAIETSNQRWPPRRRAPPVQRGLVASRLREAGLPKPVAAAVRNKISVRITAALCAQ